MFCKFDQIISEESVEMKDMLHKDVFLYCCITVILYTLQDLEEGVVKVFYETAADIADLRFAVTGHDEIFSKYEISGDTVLLIRKVTIYLKSCRLFTAHYESSHPCT